MRLLVLIRVVICLLGVLLRHVPRNMQHRGLHVFSAKPGLAVAPLFDLSVWWLYR